MPDSLTAVNTSMYPTANPIPQRQAPDLFGSLSQIQGIKSQKLGVEQQKKQLQQQDIEIAKERMAVQQNLANLNQTHREQLGSILGSYINSDASSDDIKSQVDSYVRDNPQAAGAAYFFETMLDRNSKDKNSRNAFLKQARDSVLSTQGQAGQQAPSTTLVQGPNGLQPVQMNPQAAGGVGPTSQPIQQGFSPTERFIPQTNAAGQQTLFDRGTNKVYVAQPGEGQPNNANPTAPAVSGQTHDVQQGVQMAWANRNAASVAKVNIDALGKIESLADQAQTGPGSQEFAALKSAVGGFTGIKSASNSATSVNELAKLLAQVGVQRAGALGMGGSDARLGEIEKSLPSAKADPEALKYAAQYNRALEHAALAKGDAQAKWYEEHGQDYGTHGQFEDKWRSAANPHVFQALEMPQAQAEKFYKSLPADEKAKFKADYAKLRGLGAIQ